MIIEKNKQKRQDQILALPSPLATEYWFNFFEHQAAAEEVANKFDFSRGA